MDFIIILYSFLSVLVVSLISLIGIFFTFFVKDSKMKKSLFFLVSFSAGTLLGGAFIHLLPEAIEKANGFTFNISFGVLIGIFAFFILEKFIHWRHCHIPTSKNHPHPFTYMNLVGDAFHNLLDGFLIASAYLVSVPLGISITLAIIFHEIPQEIGDFSVLLSGGFSKKKALLLNLLSALFSVLGMGIGLAFSGIINNFELWILPITAGGFIYVAASDLIPELKKDTLPKKSLLQFLGIFIGILVMFLLKII